MPEMILTKLRLQNFRHYKKQEFEFPDGTTLVIGPNTSGKTNLLEGIYLLATGKSFRASLEQEMIAYDQDLARVKGRILSRERTDLEIILTRGEVLGEKVAKKNYQVNGVSRRAMDFVGNLRCVYFGPEDLAIVVNSPATRRAYLDRVLEQVDRHYHRASLSYQKGLRQRNRLLEQIREEGKPRSVLFFWDKLLIENGGVMTQKREEFIEFINQQPNYFGDLSIQYDQSPISPARLEKYADEEVAAGMTLVGPHRDDFDIRIKGQERGRVKERSLHTFGSRGEQRTAVFSLKLGELEYVAEKTEERPVLLLDDIFSELDHERRKRLLEVIPQQQTIMTTTDIHLIEKSYQRKMEIIELDGG
jgi:DNA replication and repair protein RecF